MSRNYSEPILKKLFSLSGNICAFKSCNSKIIDEFESVNNTKKEEEEIIPLMA